MGNNKCFEQCPRCGYQETETENIISIIPETEFPEKNLYLCCRIYGQEVVWYKMNPFKSTSTAQFSTLSPICTGPEENRCSIVALGTKIYMIGGDYPTSVREANE
ncbi:hypothetical protein IFM89_029053 [Coptis chinensis]|uniref:Uncharacterized protein n=1 Tax=Coptis chinensis TaxID=261450 RepID=A0A835IGU7_9MAGN|nr:hypothetical protein IFM89_029053 [Coptis chinensis]